MRCCVPSCKNTSDNVSLSTRKEISFHGFPSDVRLCAAWVRALGMQGSHLPDSAVVCSQHFLADDIYETESGLKQIVTGAIPSTVQVCMICLDTDSKMFLMSKHKLEEAYEKLMGHPLFDLRNLKHTVCVQCAQRLINFNRFRDKSLRACTLMMDLVEKHELITKQHVKMINRTKHHLTSNFVVTILGPDPCDLYITENPSEDKQTESEGTTDRVEVKNEEESYMSVDEEMMANEDGNNADSISDELVAPKQEYLFDNSITLDSKLLDDALVETQDPLTSESAPFQCTLCSEEFVYELEYMQHMSTHIQNDVGDCGTALVCKPHTAVSSSSSHSSLLTENRQVIQQLKDDPLPSTDSGQTTVAPLSAGLVTNSGNKVQAEAADTIQKSKQIFKINKGKLVDNNRTNINRLTNCVVKLCDVLKTHYKAVLIQDKSLVKKRAAISSGRSNTGSKDINLRVVSQNNTVKVNKRNVSVTNCSKKDKSENDLLVEKKSLTCDVCRNTFKRKNILVRHLKIHADKKAFNCKVCQYKSNDKSNFNRHMRTHTGEKPFSCELCKYKFSRKNNLLSHIRAHKGESPFSCELCEYKAFRKEHLVSHMSIHTGERPFVCELCEYKAAQKKHLVKHMKTHTGIKPFSCELCEYKTAHKSLIGSHMRIHTGEKPYSCNLCKYKSSQYSHLVCHMRTHTGETPFSCEYCEYKAAQKHNLVRHMKTHTGIKPFSCELCEYKTAHKSLIESHMRIHTGEKPYSCNLCKYKSSQYSHLICHMRTHTRETPFSCEYCEYKAAHKHHLVSHMRTHTGEKPFSCELCNYQTSHKPYLINHMRTHSGDKPFSCKFCNYKTAYNTHLRRHLRTHASKAIEVEIVPMTQEYQAIMSTVNCYTDPNL